MERIGSSDLGPRKFAPVMKAGGIAGTELAAGSELEQQCRRTAAQYRPGANGRRSPPRARPLPAICTTVPSRDMAVRFGRRRQRVDRARRRRSRVRERRSAEGNL
jgi:hypothetical protein